MEVPDKAGEGLFLGAAMGAGSGAITGFQYGAGTGPGVAVGIGLGAVYGLLQGLGQDASEKVLAGQLAEIETLEGVSGAHNILAAHYLRRERLMPGRDIFPADLFFTDSSVTINENALPLIAELAHLTNHRLPWSRVVIQSYVVSSSPKSVFANNLARRRAEEFAITLIRLGVEPRRIATRSYLIDKPVVIDPDDWRKRYSQAVEILLPDNP